MLELGKQKKFYTKDYTVFDPIKEFVEAEISINSILSMLFKDMSMTIFL